MTKFRFSSTGICKRGTTPSGLGNTAIESIDLTDILDQRDRDYCIAKPKPNDIAFLEQVGLEFEKNHYERRGSPQAMLEKEKTALAAIEEPSMSLSEWRF